MNAGGRFRQDKRLANLKLLDHERSAFEKLRAGLNYQINKSRGWENNMVLDFVIFEESHVSAIQPGGPGGCRARQPHVEHSAAARAEATFAPVRSFVPPAAAIPRICRQRKDTTRWRHGFEIERRSCTMQIHGGFQYRIVFPFPTDRRDYNRFRSATAGETFRNRMSEGGMGAELQPDIHTKVSNRIDRRRELNRLPDAACPMRRVTSITVKTVASDGAEQRNGFGLRCEVDQCILERVGSGLHHRVMKRMIDSDEPGEDALCLELGEHCFD